MARSVAVAVENNFKAGLVTEPTGLNYPENSCIDVDNCVFDPFGRIYRRPGMDLELAHVTKTIDKTSAAIATYLWKNVTGDGTVSFVVLQVGTTVYFYNTTVGQTTLSLGIETGTIDLTAYVPSGAPNPAQIECQFVDGFGKLFIVHPGLETVSVTYDATNDTFTPVQVNLTIRDFQGDTADTETIDSRPASLSDDHRYNLLNQGWNSTVISSFEVSATAYPSNADVWWLYKGSTGAFDGTQIPNGSR